MGRIVVYSTPRGNEEGLSTGFKRRPPYGKNARKSSIRDFREACSCLWAMVVDHASGKSLLIVLWLNYEQLAIEELVIFRWILRFGF